MTVIKEKIKAKTYVDGRNQRRYISNDELSLLNMRLDSMMLSLIIDVRESRNVAITDVVGAYPTVKMEDYVLANLTGKKVDVMCKVRKEYEDYVCIERGKKCYI